MPDSENFSRFKLHVLPKECSIEFKDLSVHGMYSETYPSSETPVKSMKIASVILKTNIRLSDTCKDMMKLNLLYVKIHQNEIINEDLTEILMELHQDILHEITPPRTIHRRRVPLLGFIGSIL